MYSLLYLVPKNWLSRSVGWAVQRRWPFGLHVRIRDIFIRKFNVDVSESEFPLTRYPTLGEFFTRRLRPGARPVGTAALVSPVDGMLTQRGFFAQGPEQGAKPVLTQIKGIHYTLRGLVGDGWDASAYSGGAFLTLYLAPWNYHRIHSPIEGRVLRARHIAGALWPVNAWSVQNIPDLFVRNDRILVEMESGGGHIIVALVGATNVGRITLSFCPELVGNTLIVPNTVPSTVRSTVQRVPGAPGIRDWKPSVETRLGKGAELGCFEMGSTVVLILDAVWASRLKNELHGLTPLPMRVGLDLSS